MIWGFVIFAVIIGALMPMQAGINAELTRILKNPFLAAFISLTIGSIAFGLILLAKGSPFSDFRKMSEAPPYFFIGGLLGAIFVSSSLFFIPRMGATAMIASFITGQLLMSVIIDHYGLLGLAQQSVSITRVLGIILLFAGLFLVLKKNA